MASALLAKAPAKEGEMSQEEAVRVLAAAAAIPRLNERIENHTPKGASSDSAEHRAQRQRLSQIRNNYDLIIENQGADR